MKKLFKQLTVFISALTLLLAVGIFAACGGEADSGETTYTITVVTPEKNPASGVRIGFCTIAEDPADEVCTPLVADENGKITHTAPSGKYAIKILSVGGETKYALYSDNGTTYEVSQSNHDITITLELKEAE